MSGRSWPVLSCGLVLAFVVNIALFAVIPYLSRVEIPRQSSFQKRPIHIFRELPPEPEVDQAVEDMAEKEPPPPVPQPQVPQPQMPRMIQEPSLEFSELPRPSIPMASGMTSAPLGQMSDFYSAEDLDTLPRLSYQVPPLYPYRAKRMNTSGYVRIRFDVDAEGLVTNIQVLESEPPGVFDDAVLSAVAKWRFQPGEFMGDRVKTRLTRKIEFKLED